MSVVTYPTAGNAAYPSPEIWADCPVSNIVENPAMGFHIFSDFFDDIITPSTNAGPWLTVGANDTLALAATGGGWITHSLAGASNNNSCLYLPLSGFSVGLKTGRKCWFETRLSITQTVADCGIAIGLGDVAVCVAAAVANDTADRATTSFAGMVDGNFIGFSSMGGAGATDGLILDAGYKKAGVTAGLVKDACQTLVSGTNYRIGVTYDGIETVRYYINGVLVASKSLNSSGTSLLGTLCLSPLIAMNTGGAAMVATIDWIRFAYTK